MELKHLNRLCVGRIGEDALPDIQALMSMLLSVLQSSSHMPNKLFVGCLPLKPEVTSTELTEHFSQYGRLSDVYIPKPYR